MLLSIIVPCYNEKDAVPLFYKKTGVVVKELVSSEGFVQDVEFVFVDDGSTDGTLAVLKNLRAIDTQIHYVSFSRNFGKEAAIYAGLQTAKGDYIAIMDADLQDPPELLAQMFRGITEEGYDCVGARRVTRKGEPLIRSLFARMFYRIINYSSEIQLVDGARDYRLMNRMMVDAVLQLREVNRFSKGLFAWVGYRCKWLEYENVERIAGETKWSFWKLFRYSLEGIISFATIPLAISSVIGLVFCVIALLLALFYGVKAMLLGDPSAGFPTLICAVLLLGGLQLFCMGLIGQYLAKAYMEVKQRPVYIVREEE